MPGFDKTGPNGKGPMTGRKMGPCAGKNAEMKTMGRGRGNGRRNMGRFGAGPNNEKQD